MIIVLRQINSLNEIDYDYLFSESFSRIEMDYLWPPNLTTYEQKRDFYRSQIEAAINGTHTLQKEDNTFVMIATTVDGNTTEFSAGYLEADGSLSLTWNLTAPVPGGNRNWRYSPEAQRARKDFIRSLGVTAIIEYTWTGSLLYKMLKSRASLGGYTIEEQLGHEYPSGKRLVAFTIRFL